MKNICVIIHTCDKYEFCWEGWYKSFKKYWVFNNNIDVYFVNEEKDVQYDGIKQLKTGYGEWSDRLLIALKKLEYKYVFYMQEDMWMVKSIDLMYFFDLYKKFNMDALRFLNNITTNTIHYKFDNIIDDFMRFSDDSNYLISHQPSIWDKKVFIDCLNKNETPWQNEIDGTKRIINSKKKLNIYCINGFDKWYVPVSKRGNLIPISKKILKDLENDNT